MNYKEVFIKVFSAEVAAKIFLGVISIYTIRVMPTSDFASYTFAISIHLFLVSVVSSVINIIYITMDENESQELRTSFLTLQAIVLIIAAFILLPVKNLFNGLYGSVFVLTFVHFLFLYSQSYFQKLMQFDKYYAMEFFRVGFFFAAFVTYTYYKGYTINAQHMLALQTAATLLPLSVVLFKIFNFREVCNISKLKSLLIYIYYSKKILLLFYFIVVSILLNVDFMLIKLFGTEYELAEYGAAFRYYAILQVALISIQKILLPFVSTESDYSKIRNVFRQHKIISIRLLLLSPIIILMAIYLMPIINNGKYEGAIYIFLILALSSYISFSFSPYSNVLIKSNNYAFMVKIIVAAHSPQSATIYHD
jgi:O-antigen/teichoic acid export membrane protein